MVHIFRKVISYGFHPSFNILERIPVGYRINKHYSVSPLVICLGNVSETLLASCIPDLEFDFFIINLAIT